MTETSLHREVAQIHQQTYIALADGYLHIFDHEWGQVATQRQHSNDALNAATSILNCLKNALLVSFLGNDIPPENLWLRAHHVFRHIASAPLEWTQKCAEQVETVLNLYKHIMLLGIAQPFSLTPHEILLLDRELKTLAPHAHILPAQVEWDKQHVFLIHTAHDTAPRRYSHSRNFGDTQLWLLDIRDVATRFRLLQHVPQPSATSSWAASSVNLTAPTQLNPLKIEQLTRAWQTGERRVQPRSGNPRRLWITSGLIHSFDALCATTQSRLLADLALDAQAVANQRSAIWHSAQPHPVTLHSLSEAGLGLLWQDSANTTAPHIGTLMGIFTSNDTRANSLLAMGVVLWARPRGHHAWACGVQILSDTALPLVFEPSMGDIQQPSLLLPQAKMRATQARLIVLPGSPPQSEARLSDGRHAQMIRLERITTKQVQFECHEFATLHTAHTTPTHGATNHAAQIMINEETYPLRESPTAVR